MTASGTTETVVSITDDDDPQVSVKFGASTYPVAEGGSVTVTTVTLSADPERTVDIPLSAATGRTWRTLTTAACRRA